MRKKKLLLGAHMPISYGLNKAITIGESIGCTAIQIFTKSNRSWFSKKITEKEENLFRETFKKSVIYPHVVVHSSYLINLGSPKKDTEQKSITSLIEELERCKQLTIPYLIIHPGSHLHENIEKCIRQIAKNINFVFKKAPGKVQLLLENTAGQGTNIGYTFEQLREIYDQIDDKARIGYCFDTCHAFAAGYDITTKKGYEETWNKFKKILGLNKLKVIHLNNSKGEFNSKIDRHEKIGKGKIPLQTFKMLLKDPTLENVPKILETPIIQNLEEYQEEIEMLKKLVNE